MKAHHVHIDDDVVAAMKNAAYKEWMRRVAQQVTADPVEHLDAIIDAVVVELLKASWTPG